MNAYEQFENQVREANTPAEVYRLVEAFPSNPAAALLRVASQSRVWDEGLVLLILMDDEASLRLLDNPARPPGIEERMALWFLRRLDNQGFKEERRTKKKVLLTLAERGLLSADGEATRTLLEMVTKRRHPSLSHGEKVVLDLLAAHATLRPEQLEVLVDELPWKAREQQLPWAEMVCQSNLTPLQRRRLFQKLHPSAFSFHDLELLLESEVVRRDEEIRTSLVQRALQEGAEDLIQRLTEDGLDDCVELFHILLHRDPSGRSAAEPLRRAPHRVAPCLAAEDLESLFRSPDAEVRLTAISVAGQLRGGLPAGRQGVNVEEEPPFRSASRR